MFSKTLIAALIVASAAATLTQASARPEAKPAPTSHENFYMERASQNHDNGGN
jgi:hypothetical protein